MAAHRAKRTAEFDRLKRLLVRGHQKPARSRVSRSLAGKRKPWNALSVVCLALGIASRQSGGALEARGAHCLGPRGLAFEGKGLVDDEVRDSWSAVAASDSGGR